MKKLLSFVAAFLLATLQILSAQCLEGNCWNGEGIHVYPSGAKYVGQFKSGKIHGKGVLYFSNGNVYNGDWVDHYRDGEGTLSYTDGGEYTGQFKSSQFNGKGIFKYPNGDRYNGNWADNKAEGEGTYKFKDGDRYEGTFKKGKFHGDGTMFYKDGAKYTGQWKNNQKNGSGVFTNTDGRSMNGEWIEGTLANNRNEVVTSPVESESTTATSSSSALRDCNNSYCKSGKGEYKYTDGSRYVGTFLEGLPVGEGTVFYQNGDKYVGGWAKHAPHGFGIMYYRYGRVLGAQWRYGTVVKIEQDSGKDIVKEHIEVDEDKAVKIWAVVIGVARYNHMPALKYTDDDAYQIYAFLKSPEGGALPDEQIRVLIDEDATRANILRSMRQVFLQADENDVIVFYFSGHGYDGSFIPSDYDGYSNLLKHTEVQKILEESKAKHKICYADACHSGSADAMAMRQPYDNTLDKYYSAFKNSKGGVVLFMSSKEEEVSLEDHGLRQGIFSHFLIRGLKGEADTNQNKIITIQELYTFVQKKVKRYTANAQNPTLSGKHDGNMPVAVIR